MQYSYSVQQLGGAVRCSLAHPSAPAGSQCDAGERGLAWQIENGAAGTLNLMPFDNCSSAPPHPSVTISFPTQIFPGVACVEQPGGGGFLVVGLTASGLAFHVDLNQFGGEGMKGRTPPIHYADLSPHWSSVGAPTCISSADGHVLVGGAHGPLLCLPLPWLRQQQHTGTAGQPFLPPPPLAHQPPASHTPRQQQHQPFELRESSWGLKSFIAGVLQRQHSPSAVAVAPLPVYLTSSKAAGGVVVVTYDDCTLRGFSLLRRSQVGGGPHF